MRHRRVSHTVSFDEVAGPWSDLGQGICLKCSEPRRLYSPTLRPDIRVCAKCSQIYATSVLPDREEAA